MKLFVLLWVTFSILHAWPFVWCFCDNCLSVWLPWQLCVYVKCHKALAKNRQSRWFLSPEFKSAVNSKSTSRPQHLRFLPFQMMPAQAADIQQWYRSELGTRLDQESVTRWHRAAAMPATLLFFCLLTCCGACVPGQGGSSRAAYARGKGEQPRWIWEGGGRGVREVKVYPLYILHFSSDRRKERSSRLSSAKTKVNFRFI